MFSSRHKPWKYLTQNTIKRLMLSTQKNIPPIEYCANLVQSRDYENYLCLNLLPPHAKAVGFAVRAFNVEVAQIQEATTIVETGKIRIQFWRENISKTFLGRPPNHPVTVSLALCLEKQMLSENWFQRIIDIREKYLNNISFMSLDDAEEYGEYALSSIFYLLLEGVGIQEHQDSSYAASHLGVASSLVTLIRSTEHLVKSGHVVLPTELLMKHKLSQEDVIRNSNPTALKEVIYDLASQASLHLKAADKLLKCVPTEAKNVYLPYFSIKMFLKHIQILHFDAFHPTLNKTQWYLPAVLWYKSRV